MLILDYNVKKILNYSGKAANIFQINFITNDDIIEELNG